MYNAEVKKYSRYYNTNDLTKKAYQYQRLSFVDLLFMARSINQKNNMEFVRYSQMLENDANFANFLKQALQTKKAFSKRFSNYKVLMTLSMSEYKVTMKTNNVFYIVTRETKNGFEKYKFDNLTDAKKQYHKFLTK